MALHEEATVEADSELATDQTPVNILLVDDQPANLRYLRLALEDPAHRIWLAGSGPDAMAEIRKREFAAVLLDVAMPGMDGFEVARRIRREKRSASTPILFVTASTETPDWSVTAYSVGGVDFLQKPLDLHAVRGKVAFFVQLFRQRKQLARQARLLRESEARAVELELTRLKLQHEHSFRVLTEALPAAIWTASPHGQMGYFNRHWYQLTGLDEPQSLGDGWLSAVHPDDAAEVSRTWRTAVRSGSELYLELRLGASGGPHPWHLARALPELGPEGQVTRWLGAFTDVDEQKQANEQAREALRLRDEFLSIASHELRTPLTSLQLQMESVIRLVSAAQEGLDPRFRDKVQSAARQVERLSTLIDTLLDLSRISAGQLRLNRELFDLAAVVVDVAERWRDAAHQVGCELRCIGQGPLIGRGDTLRLEQVLTNLISNAIKYGPGKPIDLVMTGGSETIQLSVCDRGIGIAAHDLPRIFGRFERAASSCQSGGLGLGLYIARQIVEAHGATIDVSSEVGVGSKFTVTLPIAAAGVAH
jgi:PAS domain S-box-containing protein